MWVAVTEGIQRELVLRRDLGLTAEPRDKGRLPVEAFDGVPHLPPEPRHLYCLGASVAHLTSGPCVQPFLCWGPRPHASGLLSAAFVVDRAGRAAQHDVELRACVALPHCLFFVAEATGRGSGGRVLERRPKGSLGSRGAGSGRRRGRGRGRGRGGGMGRTWVFLAKSLSCMTMGTTNSGNPAL